jgi:hypothetical protein
LAVAQRRLQFSFTQALTIFVLVLQSFLIVRRWSTHQNSVPQNEDLIEKRWLRNTSYISLSHVYNNLWNETSQLTLVFDDDKNVVQITMQAFARSLHFDFIIGLDEKDNTHWPHYLQFLREVRSFANIM